MLIRILFVATMLIAGSLSKAEKPAVDAELRDLLLAAVADSASFEDRFDAEVWLTDMSARLRRQVPDDEERLHILRRVHHEATRVDLPPELILATRRSSLIILSLTPAVVANFLSSVR